jgi:hypothetical protein
LNASVPAVLLAIGNCASKGLISTFNRAVTNNQYRIEWSVGASFFLVEVAA